MTEYFTPLRSAEGIYEFKHEETGLTVLLVPKPGLNITTANITYRVGSRNEGLGVRGATHYLEHGMFKGSKLFNSKLNNGMWKLEEFGAYMNATTYTDRTNYFAVIDSDKLDEVITREADRMYEPLLDACELKKEMTVVRNEFERGENNDFEVLQKRVMATAFMAHPYHHSTIGWRSEIENVSAEALRKFHDTFYKPSNATYTFCGNFQKDKVLEMVHEAFNKEEVDNSPVPDMYTTEPTQMGQRRVLMKRPTNCALMCMSFKAPNGLHPDAIALEVIANIISKGPQALSETFKRDPDLPVHDIIAEWERMRDPYLFSIWGTTNQPSEEALQHAENTICTITDMVKSISDDHLQRTRKYILNEWQNELLGTRKMAMAINEAIARGDPFDIHRRVEILNALTIEDIHRVAKKYFVMDKSTVGWLLHGPTAEDIVVENYEKLETKIFDQDIELPYQEKGEFKVSDGVVTKLKKAKTDMHISFQHLDTSLAGYIYGNLLGELMTKGCNLKGKKCGEKQLYEFLAQQNIQRHIYAGTGTLNVQASIKNDVVPKATRLLENEIENPLLDEHTFEYLKGKWIAELNGSRNNVNTLAKIAFRQALFKPNDPNYKYSVDKIITAINSINYDGLKNYHKKVCDSPKIITVVGDVDKIDMQETNGWKYEFKNDLMASGRNDEIKVDGKSSVVLKYGCVVEKSAAVKLAAAVLGNGFTGKLMKIVRDEHGLTYGINARVSDLQGCSVFEITGTFSPKLLQEGVKWTEKVIKDWLENDITLEELQVQKNETIGSQMVQYDAPGALASAIHHSKIMCGNVNGINGYKDTITKITLDEVNQAKGKIQFENLSKITVGTF